MKESNCRCCKNSFAHTNFPITDTVVLNWQSVSEITQTRTQRGKQCYVDEHCCMKVLETVTCTSLGVFESESCALASVCILSVTIYIQWQDTVPMTGDSL